MRKALAILLSISLVLPCINSFVVLADDVVIETENPDTTVGTEDSNPTEVPVITVDPATEEPVSSDEPIVTDTPEPTEIPEPTDTPIPTDTPEPVVYDLGDVDGSEVINAADSLSVLKYAAKISELDYSSSVSADVDKSGTIDAKDALYILQYAAKIIVRFVFTPEENFQVIKDYIIEKGTINENGNIAVYTDYSANGESLYEKEYEYFELIKENGQINYGYVVDDVDPLNCMKFVISIYEDKTSEVEVIWNQSAGSKYAVLSNNSRISNSFYTLDYDFSKDFNYEQITNDINVALMKEGISTVWKNDIDDIYNGLVHLAFYSMWDYLNNTVVMRLSDVYPKYNYSEEKIVEILNPVIGIDNEIIKELGYIKDDILRTGVTEDNLVYKTIEKDNSKDYYMIRLNYDKTYEYVYFDGVIYNYSENISYYFYTEILSNRSFYVYFDKYTYNAKGDETLVSSGEQIISSMTYLRGSTYEFDCLYPNGGNVDNANVSKYLAKFLNYLNDSFIVNLRDLGFYRCY